MRHQSRALGLVAAGLAWAGLVGGVRAQEAAGAAPARPITAPGIAHLFRLGDRVYSGAQPEGPEGFATLRRLGVTTVVSVDGARPDVEAARRAGLRYVHLPIGYDGVTGPQALRIVQAVRSSPGPIFIHCHHGKHRGPTAAALACQATEGWDRERATAWLRQAGTSPDYRGLFETVGAFRAPSRDELGAVPAALPERAAVPPIVEAMVQIDERWDHLTATRDAGYRAPPGHPDIDPPHEALLLAEHFRELRRRQDRRRGPDFDRRLREAEEASLGLESALRRFADGRSEADRKGADDAFRTAAERCTACHETFRNRRPRDERRGDPDAASPSAR